MSDHELTYQSTMCYPNFTALNFVTIPISMEKKTNKILILI